MNTNYTPRAGSKVSLATQALLDGPMSAVQLAKVIDTEVKNLPATLAISIEHGLIIKVKDETGLLHFALGGMVIDERFVAYDAGGTGTTPNARGRALTEAPFIRSVKKPSVMPSPAALAAANPFKPAAPIAPSAVEKIDLRKKKYRKKPAAANAQAASGPAEVSTVNNEIAFRAGLFSDGQLMIAAGERSITLCAEHTRELFDYLDKVTDMIAGQVAGIGRAY